MARAKRGTGRDALLTAAMQLISERGLQGLTMRDVATVAEMSLGLTTYHFADRDALLRETLQRFVDTELERYERLLADLTKTHASVEEGTRRCSSSASTPRSVDPDTPSHCSRSAWPEP